jgi:hypothetical protein
VLTIDTGLAAETKVKGFPKVELKLRLGFGKEMKKNGRIDALELVPVKNSNDTP